MQKYGFCFLRECFFVLQYIVPCPRNTHKWHHNTSYHIPEHPQNGIALVLFGNIIFTYFWVLPTFLYLTNFAFAKEKYYKTNSK
ncbi:MAG: hypothetical protein D8B57_10655 [Prevotella sp.]|nr:MAG: hypothetical protein D8B57_10655 [Prevotella sp.]